MLDLLTGCIFIWRSRVRLSFSSHTRLKKEKLTRLLNSTILAMISLSILEKIESPMNSMSLLVSWSTNTWEHRRKSDFMKVITLLSDKILVFSLFSSLFRESGRSTVAMVQKRNHCDTVYGLKVLCLWYDIQSQLKTPGLSVSHCERLTWICHPFFHSCTKHRPQQALQSSWRSDHKLKIALTLT